MRHAVGVEEQDEADPRMPAAVVLAEGDRARGTEPAGRNRKSCRHQDPEPAPHRSSRVECPSFRSWPHSYRSGRPYNTTATEWGTLEACAQRVSPSSQERSSWLRPGLAATPAPGLRFLDLSPVKVQGTHFAPRRAREADAARRHRRPHAHDARLRARRLHRRASAGSPSETAAAASSRSPRPARGGHRAAYKLPSMACPAMTQRPVPLRTRTTRGRPEAAPRVQLGRSGATGSP